MGGARAAAVLAGEAAFDKWVTAMGGYGSAQFAALHREAREFADPDGYWAYLDMARQIDKEHEAAPGRWLSREVELANARVARRRGEEAAAAVLRRSTEIRLAAEQLLADPRLAGPDLSAGPEMSPSEIALELRAALGLASRAPAEYVAKLPPAGDLARTIGIRS